MSDFDRAFVAPLVRGLYLDALGRAVTIVPGDTGGSGDTHRDALTVDLPQPFDVPRAEAEAAAVLRAAFERWRGGRGQGPLPGCSVVSHGGVRTAYWPGDRIDDARHRASRRDGSPWAANPAAGREPDRQRPAAGSAAGRSSVVDGRIAFVTGGAQGFGEEITRGLAASGALVFVADRNLDGAERLSADLNARLGRTAAIPVAMDVADEASVEAAFAFAARAAGGLDLVVSNAGVLKAGSVLEQDAAEFRFVTEVNYTGFFHVAKRAALLLRRQRTSAPRWATDIIQINSKSGLAGSNKNGAYAGSKFGGIGLVQSYALELVEYGVKVNAVCPGNFFDGPLWSDPANGLFVQYLKSGKVPGARSVADVRAFYEAKVPMGRGCEGPDVMRAVYYLVEQEYETGQALPVTGGQVMLG
jgi:sorbitol-6-phosphate 2-dehydrogenase